MRYINCARHFDEQNIISEQIDVDIFYKVIKVCRTWDDEDVERQVIDDFADASFSSLPIMCT